MMRAASSLTNRIFLASTLPYVSIVLPRRPVVVAPEAAG